MTMTPELLRQVGIALYGTRWPKAMGAALGVSRSTAHRWINGENPIPANVPERLCQAINSRRDELTVLALRLRE